MTRFAVIVHTPSLGSYLTFVCFVYKRGGFNLLGFCILKCSNVCLYILGIPPIKEDTVTVSQTMRAASPPATGAEIIESGRRRRGMLGRMAKQNSLDDMGIDLGNL